MVEKLKGLFREKILRRKGTREGVKKDVRTKRR